jgi:hypothetical protein
MFRVIASLQSSTLNIEGVETPFSILGAKSGVSVTLKRQSLARIMFKYL